MRSIATECYNSHKAIEHALRFMGGIALTSSARTDTSSRTVIVHHLLDSKPHENL